MVEIDSKRNESQNADTNTAINLDASDPDLAAHNARLRVLGAVQPAPTHSNSATYPAPATFPSSSTALGAGASSQPQQPGSNIPPGVFPSAGTNPAITLLRARERLAKEADEEFEQIGKSSGRQAGRRFLDALTIRQILTLKESGVTDEEIEKRMELRKGVLRLLGKGVVSLP